MKISYNWLKRYLPVTLSADEAAALLTGTGLEVEGLEKVESIRGGLHGVVIGKVLTCVEHPNSDHLHITTVDVGSADPLHVVCGASNVAAGQKVLVATIGTTLYFGDDAVQIKKSKIRGELSEGMICAEDELGIGTSHAGIMVLPEEAQIGMTAREYLSITDDYVFEIGLTPNRTDATSHIGVARELRAAMISAGYHHVPDLSYPGIDDFKVDNLSLDIPVIVEDKEACPRYSGVSISGVTVSDSPEWLRISLQAIGIRPINNIVDITNFVLMETGQPLHAFDAQQIIGHKVVVKKLEKDSVFVTLDGVERKLSGQDLMICNEKDGMCIAGVFGGEKSGVSSSTTTVFLESACFDPATIRKTGKFHGLHTDASFRYERGSDPAITVYALKRAALLIKEIAGGSVSSNVYDIQSKPIQKAEVEVDYNRMNTFIGQPIPTSKVLEVLSAMEYEIISRTDEKVKVAVPTNRVDVTREVDVIEDILRVYGYNNIEIGSRYTASHSPAPKPDSERLRNMISEMLTGAGFSEIMTLSLTTSQLCDEFDWVDQQLNVTLVNPLSRELNVMRQNLLFSSLDTVRMNVNRKRSDMMMYEFGRVYRRNPSVSEEAPVTKRFTEELKLSLLVTGNLNVNTWHGKAAPSDFFILRKYVQDILTRLGYSSYDVTLKQEALPMFSQGVKIVIKNQEVGIVGIVSNKLQKYFDLKQPVFYAELSWEKLMKAHKMGMVTFEPLAKYPEVKRDLAMVIPHDITFATLKQVAYQTEPKLLKSVDLFDVYEGDNIEAGKKSYALSFILLDTTKTLTDTAIDKTMQRLIKAYEDKVGAIIRK